MRVFLLDLDIFPQVLRADVRREDVARIIRRDARGRGAPHHLVKVGRVRNKGLERSVPGVALLGGWIRKRGADVNGVVFADKHGAWLAELMPRGNEVAFLIEDLNAEIPTIGDIDAVL